MVERKLYQIIKDCAFSTILYIARILFKSITLWFLWNWIVSTILPIQINLLQSTGLIIITMFFAPSTEKTKIDDRKQMWKYFFDDLIHSSVCLMFGYILSLLLK